MAAFITGDELGRCLELVGSFFSVPAQLPNVQNSNHAHPTKSSGLEPIGAEQVGSKPVAKMVTAQVSVVSVPASIVSKPAPAIFVEPLRRRRPALGPEPKLPMAGQRNILVTSALPYVNNVPHLGNIIGCVLSADVYARYCRQRGLNCVYICGTDEYGTATEAKATEEGLTPRAVCDKYFEKHRTIYEWFDIRFDYFGRTSCPDPRGMPEWQQTVIAQSIFRDNLERGNLLEQSVEQVYCLGCEKFLADRFVVGTCPHCAFDDARGDQCDKCGKLLNSNELKSPFCKFHREHTVEVRSSTHLFLDLPRLEPALREFIQNSSVAGAWSENSKAVTESWLASGLKPRCITRDLKWGTPVPHPRFENKVFYVWFDAPIGYLSMTACYTPEWRQWWQNPSNVQLVQFMGKDNVPFHTVIFPSSLIGTGREWTMLHHISTTEYLNYEDGKFSKSRGVGVFGDNAMDTGIPSEIWRYYLLSNRPEASDSAFSWSDFAAKNNDELLKNLGNFVQRALMFAFEKFDGTIPGVRTPLEPRDTEFIGAITALLSEFNTTMNAVHLKAGLRLVMEMSAEGNRYMQDTKPWDIFKSATPDRCATVITLVASLIRLLANVMEPFMPGFSDKVLNFLSLDHGDIPDVFDVCIPAGHTIIRPTPLFNAISASQINGFRSQFSGEQVLGSAASPTSRAAQTALQEPGVAAAKGSKKSVAAAASLPEIAQIDLRVGRIVRAWPHPEADKLWCEEVDIGEGVPRKIASGLRQYYSQSQMEGRRIIVVANLKPRTMVGFESQGMVLCASNADRSVVEFVEPPESSANGERITVLGLSEIAGKAPDVVNPAKKGNPWTTVASDLATNSERVACYRGTPLNTSAGPCTAPTQAGAPIS